MSRETILLASLEIKFQGKGANFIIKQILADSKVSYREIKEYFFIQKRTDKTIINQD